jgi:hypothetical protein
MKSILMGLALVFSTSVFADVTNGTYECTFQQENNESFSFIFDLADEFMVVYDDDNKTIESILLINEDENVWSTDSEGDKYKVERTQYVLRTTFSYEEKDEGTGEVLYKGLTVTEMRETKDGKFLFKVNETEIDVTSGKPSNSENLAVCTKK